jgi:predicted transcriptional regulator
LKGSIAAVDIEAVVGTEAAIAGTEVGIEPDLDKDLNIVHKGWNNIDKK